MALGKKGRVNGKSYSLRLKLKDGAKFLECAQFEITEKVGDKYEATGKTEDVSGDLFMIETRVFEHDQGPIRSFKLGLRDNSKTPNESYFVDVGLGSGVGRSLANSVLNLKAFNDVQIGLYGQKSKTDEKTYPTVSLRQGDAEETVKWKYDPKDKVIPAALELKGRGGKIEKDWTEVEIFLLEKLEEFAATLPKSKSVDSTAKPAKADKAAVTAGGPDDETVPF